MSPEPFDVLVNPYYEAHSPIAMWEQHDPLWRDLFFLTMRKLYALVTDLRPQLIIFPMRGASPFLYSLRALNRVNPDPLRYDELCLPIGTTVLPADLSAGVSVRKRVSEEEQKHLRAAFPSLPHVISNPDSWVKWALIRTHMDEYCAQRGSQPLSSVVLIDEMQNGGTSTRAAYLMDAYLEGLRAQGQAIALHLIAVQDERVLTRAQYRKAQAWQELTQKMHEAARRIHYHEFVTPLFSVDLQPVLAWIIAIEAAPLSQRFQVVHNTVMQAYFMRELGE